MSKTKQLAIDDIVKFVDVQITDARAKIHSAELALLIAQREWCLAAGIAAAHAAHRAMLPILAAEPNTSINLSDSKVAAFAVKLSELNQQISTLQQKGMVN